jgi:V8-like Glu-specific endopeptidase
MNATTKETTITSALAESDKTTTPAGIQAGNPAVRQRLRNRKPKTMIASFTTMLAFTVFGYICQGMANAQEVRHVDGLTVITVQAGEAPVDFVNAKPMQMPENPLPSDSTQALIRALQTPAAPGPSGGSPGAKGTGIMTPVFLGTPAHEPGVVPDDWGTSSHPFTTSRADLYGLNTNTAYPYSAVGRLYFNVPGGSEWCSASLIKPGVVVTAAHCIANYGKQQFYSNWTFTPGYSNGNAPFGVWKAQSAIVLTVYYNGTDNCAQYGVICPDDVGLVVENGLPGNATGFLGWYYNGGFTPNGLGQITQLGYSAGLDNLAYMERTDSYSYTNGSLSNNHIIGTNMNNGSSGGPWIENFGMTPVLTGETNGSFPYRNVVVGVTSWGYLNLAVKEAGASPFTGNIVGLVSTVCAIFPGNC